MSDSHPKFTRGRNGGGTPGAHEAGYSRAVSFLSREDQGFRAIFEQAAIGIAALDAETGAWMEVNAALCRMLGYTREELLARTWRSITHPDDIGAGLERRAALRSGRIESYTLEKRYVHKSGRTFWARVMVSLLRGEDGECELSLVEDIDRRKRSESAAALRARQLQTLIERAPVGIYLIDAAFRMRHVNPVALRSFAGIPGGVEGRDFEEVHRLAWPDALVDEVVAIFRNTLATGESYECPELIQRRIDRGVNEAYAWRVDRITQADGSFGLVCYFADISSQVQARERLAKSNDALRAANERFQLAQEAAGIGHWDWDLRSGELTWSERCRELFGIAPAEPVSYERVLLAIAPEDRERVDAAVRRALERRDGYEADLRVRPPDGSERELISRGRAYYDPDGKPLRMSGMVFDVSERRRTERALHQEELRNRQMLEALPQLVWTCDAEGQADYLSPQWLRYTGSSLGENLGSGWTRFVHPADLAPLLSAWTVSMRAGEALDVEARIRGKDGQYRWFMQRAVPLRAADGAIGQWFGTSTEITDLIEARNAFERRVHERTEQLEEANAELQAFAHSVAHDLRAPLRNIHGYATAILEDEAPHLTEDGTLYAQRLIESASRLDELIQDLLAYSRLSRAQITPERVELEIAMARVLGAMSEEIATREARLEVQPGLPAVLGHRSTLVQVLTNLISNALKFVASDVTPHVRISASCDEHWVRLTVADNGLGIEPRHHKQVFGVFERLHSAERYPGTGIGLAIVKKGIERMGGSVQLESAPGEGSRFTLSLPRASGQVQ